MAEMQEADESGRLADNIMHFARLLRSTGMPVGSDRLLNAIRGVREIGIGNREEFYWTLFANLVSRQEQREIFDQAFHIFWRNPRILEKLLGAMLPTVRLEDEAEQQELSRRLTEAMAGSQEKEAKNGEDDQIEVDASLTFSAEESLRDKDFDKMTTSELLEARRAIAHFRLAIPEVPTRRFKPGDHGQAIDMRATLRASLRNEAAIPLRNKVRRRRPPPLVFICDISGSMSRYSRLFLHFMHAVTNDRDRVHAFVFATRLSNISHHLRQRDVDEALQGVTGAVQDWSGGTRIGSCLKDFNANWSRRVLGQGAVTILVTDGLDREDTADLGGQMERLAKSSRQLIWLNPLLRYSEFEPRARGVRAMLPHVDQFRAAHNLNSLQELVTVFGSTSSAGSFAARRGLMTAS